MKKNFLYAMMSAIALSGAVSFSACSSNEDVVEEVKVTGETVKTQFAIGITSEASAKTRMTEKTTQAQTSPVFRGMDYFILIPFDKTPAATVDRIGSYITAGSNKIKGSEVTTPSEGLNGNANYTVFDDVVVPVGTSHFLFYGRAPQGTNVESKFSKGYLTVSNAVTSSADFDTPTSLTFTPTPILSGKDEVEAGGSPAGQNLIALLTKVANASVTESGTTTKWSDVTQSQNALLYQAFDNFTKLESGSSFNVQRTIQDLYILVNDLAQLADNPYKPLAAAIQTAIKNGANGTDDNGGEDDITASGTGINITLTFPDDYNGYPADLNLPEGATHITFVAGDTQTAHKFEDKMTADGGDVDQTGAAGTSTDETITPPTTTSKKTKYSTYAYPADLWYWKSTALKASNEIESTNFSASQGWTTVGTNTGILEEWYGDALNVVSGSSKSVALVEPIDYAVARLDLNIAALPTDPITDSRKNVMDFSKTPAQDPVHGFNGAIELTGVLIGYQQQVDWEFKPVTGREYVIYDTIPTPKVLGAETGKNHTLVLQTPKDETVNIALQFVNKGPDFYGKGGQLIPSGGTFYLTGGLNPTAATGVTGYASGTKDKVFIQDYVTSVTLTLLNGGNTDSDGDGIVDDDDSEGFQEATNTIPDLRTPKLELCFSVDLTWEPGLTFNVEW